MMRSAIVDEDDGFTRSQPVGNRRRGDEAQVNPGLEWANEV